MTLEIYDTTLRDGSQQEGISLTVNDKLRIAGLLDDLGVAFIEGGMAGSESEGHQVLRACQDRTGSDHGHIDRLWLNPSTQRRRRLGRSATSIARC